jgi:hypothetical protein
MTRRIPAGTGIVAAPDPVERTPALARAGR